MIKKPLLAATIKDPATDIKFPCLVSYKLDGIRCLTIDGDAVSRKFKPIPNHFIRKSIATLPDGVDGEIMIPGVNFNDVQSAVMRQTGSPVFEYHVFDYVDTSLSVPYVDRIKRLEKLVKVHTYVKIIKQVLITNLKSLLELEKKALDLGYEGLMIRSIDGTYKCGRSTLKEGILLKLKRFEDSEAEIIGFTELEHNNNPKEKDELGQSKRSSKQSGKSGANTLGNFLVRDIKSGVEFEIGTGEGLTGVLRKKIWLDKNQYLGTLVKYKFQPTQGAEKPRFPVWLGFRDKIDL